MRNPVSFVLITALAAPLAAQSLPGLENFSIERPAPPPVVTPSPAPTTVPPSPTPVAPSPAPTPTPSPTPTAPSPAATASPTPRPTAATPTPTPGPDSDRIPSATATLTPPPPPTAATPVANETAALPPASSDGSAMPGWLVWLLAVIAVAVIAGAAWWAMRRRADGPDEEIYEPEFVAPPPVPAPAPPPSPVEVPPPAPVSPPAQPGGLVTTAAIKAPGGLVTTAFRPELEFRLIPVRAGIDTLRATLEFSLTVVNTGRGAAHDVQVEAWLLAADRDPRGLIAELLAQDPGQPFVQPFALPPTAAVDLPGQATAPREQLATITAGERKLFVPMLVVRAIWHDGRGRPDGTGAAFMVGVPRQGQDRLAPLPLDRGARGYTTLAALRFDA